MRKFVFYGMTLLAVAATGQEKTAREKKPPAPAAAQRGSIAIPEDAVQIGPQVYRWKDATGKSWLYRKTPFGISKMEELVSPQVSSEPGAAAVGSRANSKIKVKAEDRGDSVRFEQLTPMGARVWERKKSELTAEEKAWLEETNNGGKESAKPEK